MSRHSQVPHQGADAPGESPFLHGDAPIKDQPKALVHNLLGGVQQNWHSQDLSAVATLIRDRLTTSIRWYDRHSNRKKRLSTALRGAAILLGVVGGALPFLPASLFVDTISTSVAHYDSAVKSFALVSIILAGGLLAVDKLFSISTSWMRFKLTQMQLEQALQIFEVRWKLLECARDVDAERAKAMATIAEETSLACEAIVLKESESWILEFQASLLQFDRYLSDQRLSKKKPVKP
jgi:hypothetical protein